ncbi:SDR family oxidoreductase [uncultured Flavobacterium sp.]|uniref:SDR family NAD(P)-dependent oxidoreductase n=1 Tax=uncultured Flavobacterium sp. TaxID=165435 RepID=UPI0030CA2CCA
MKYNNKTVLIIGGSSGIGLATAKKYATKKAHVIIVGKTKEKLKKAAQEMANNTTYYPADITSLDSLKELYEKLNKKQIQIDVLIITAGLGKFGSLDEVSEEEYDLVMNTNTKGTFFSVSILGKLVKNGGSIILLSSFLANKFIPLTAVLSASKVAVETFTKIFARELSPKGIRVNAVSPGSIKTNFMNVANPSEDQQNRLLENMPKIPLGKRGETEEIANTILFLSSEEASYINGSILSVDGGLAIA